MNYCGLFAAGCVVVDGLFEWCGSWEMRKEKAVGGKNNVQEGLDEDARGAINPVTTGKGAGSCTARREG